MLTAQRNALLLAKLRSFTEENSGSPQLARAALKREGIVAIAKPKAPAGKRKKQG